MDDPSLGASQDGSRANRRAQDAQQCAAAEARTAQLLSDWVETVALAAVPLDAAAAFLAQLPGCVGIDAAVGVML